MSNFNYQIRFANNANIDVAAGVIRAVSLITAGVVAGHKCFADRTTLETVLAACKALGVLKVKANHGADVGSIVGSITNFRIEGNQVKGDLTLLKNSPSRNYVLEIAQTLASQIGLSIAFEPTWESKGGKEFVRCKTIYSADIVDAPAANPQGLFDTTPTLTNTATVVPTGHKIKDKSVGVVCPTCNAHEELLSKLATLHSDAAKRLGLLCSVFESKANISSVPTEQQFQARLNAQRLELEKGLDAKASVMASRMLASTGVRLSKIPDADTCMNTGDTILARLESISDPTEKGRFFQANKAAIRTAYQQQASKNIDLENRVKATNV